MNGKLSIMSPLSLNPSCIIETNGIVDLRYLPRAEAVER